MCGNEYWELGMSQGLQNRKSVEARGNFKNVGRTAGNENRRWHGTLRSCTLGDQGTRSYARRQHVLSALYLGLLLIYLSSSADRTYYPWFIYFRHHDPITCFFVAMALGFTPRLRPRSKYNLSRRRTVSSCVEIINGWLDQMLTQETDLIQNWKRWCWTKSL